MPSSSTVAYGAPLGPSPAALHAVFPGQRDFFVWNNSLAYTRDLDSAQVRSVRFLSCGHSEVAPLRSSAHSNVCTASFRGFVASEAILKCSRWQIFGGVPVTQRDSDLKSSTQQALPRGTGAFPPLQGHYPRVNQVWSTDITYIRLHGGFIYLVAVMDWFSRYVLSWAVSITMDVSFCLEALDQALEVARPDIFNTDQGAQFTGHDFTERLAAAGFSLVWTGGDGRSTMSL